MRVSREEEGLMKGARVVWSRGHVAANDFRDGEFFFLPPTSPLFSSFRGFISLLWDRTASPGKEALFI